MPRPASDTPTQPTASVARLRIGVVVSRYNAVVTEALLDGAREAFLAAGGAPERLTVIDAPGAWELISLCHAAAAARRFDGLVALGCIVKGQTRHDEYLATSVCQSLADISVRTAVPIALGVLTVNDQKQAAARAGGRHGNKGEEAMAALLATLEQLSMLHAGPGRRSDRAGGRGRG